MANTIRFWDGTRWTENSAPYLPQPAAPPLPAKSMGAAYALLVFLGGFAAHRFYLDRVGSAIVQLLLGTGGWLTSLAGLGGDANASGWGAGMLLVFYGWLFLDLFLTAHIVWKTNAARGYR